MLSLMPRCPLKRIQRSISISCGPSIGFMSLTIKLPRDFCQLEETRIYFKWKLSIKLNLPKRAFISLTNIISGMVDFKVFHFYIKISVGLDIEMINSATTVGNCAIFHNRSKCETVGSRNSAALIYFVAVFVAKRQIHQVTFTEIQNLWWVESKTKIFLTLWCSGIHHRSVVPCTDMIHKCWDKTHFHCRKLLQIPCTHQYLCEVKHQMD